MDIEKNDVDLTQLFLWKGEVSVVNHRQEEVAKVYMRLVGDKDLNRARVYALRQSTDLRTALHNKKTDEYQAFIQGIEFTNKEKLEAGIKLLLVGDLASDARRNALVKFPKEPSSDASLEEHEKHQKKVDEFPEKFGTLVEKELKKLVRKEEKRLTTLSDQELKDEYIESSINFLCQEEMNRSFSNMCVYLGTYQDKKYRKKYFRSFDKYDNIASEVKDQLRDAYRNLELGMTELKKLQEATPLLQPGALQEETGE